MHQRQRIAATRQRRADTNSRPVPRVLDRHRRPIRPLRRFIDNPVKHALLQYTETHGPDTPPPLDYKIGVNHIYRHHGIGVVLHLRPTQPDIIELLKDIVADERERLTTKEAEERLLRLVKLLDTRTPSHSTLNAIRAVVILAEQGAASGTDRTAW